MAPRSKARRLPAAAKASAPTVLTAAQLAPLVNGYRINHGPPRVISVPHASQLAGIRDITVTGKLLKKQLVALDPKTNKRTAAFPAGGGGYKAQPDDGDLHFCLGTAQLKPHIACELQSAKPYLSIFNQAIGSNISVSGFFRCMFEHPGFKSNDDAHIFEIHPVRAATLGGYINTFMVGIPDQNSIHTWTSPRPLGAQDARIKVEYDRQTDTLTFTGMDGQDENYVHVAGLVSAVKLGRGAPSTFTFTSPDVGYPLDAMCLQGTTAEAQLGKLKGNRVSLITLRNIDLAKALTGTYAISLLAIDIQPG
jgi:hypothetical protein